MNLGNKILELRKKHNITQEELAEKVGVTRQTISKWELNETSPDINQAKSLSKIFKISLDELVNNDIKDLIIERVSNTEKLAGLIIKIIKFIGIALCIFFVIDIVALILFTTFRKEPTIEHAETATISCTLAGNDYLISVGSDGYSNCSNCSNTIQKDINDILDYGDIDSSMNNIKDYFRKHDGDCE